MPTAPSLDTGSRVGDDAAIDPGIARDLGEFSRWLAAESDTAAVMDRIVRAAVSKIDGATGAGITLVAKGAVSSPTHSDDLRRDTRWPAWAAAAIAPGGSRKIDNLRIALDSRDVIGQAKGVLMERLKIDAAQAFDLLAYISQRENLKLYDLAESIASTGVLPNAG